MNTRILPALFFLFLLVSVASPAFAQYPTTTNTWAQLPSTNIDSVCACNHGYPNTCGQETFCAAITSNWCSSFYDSRRNDQYFWCGGHFGGYDNSLYKLDLDTSTLTRATNPGPSISTLSPGCYETVADGSNPGVNGTQPNARHTYDGLSYARNVDKLFVYGGGVACENVDPLPGNGGVSSTTWLYNLATSAWERPTTTGGAPVKELGIITDYETTTGLIWLWDRRGLYSFNPSTYVYTLRFGDTTSNRSSYHGTGVIDQVRHKFFYFGGGEAYYWNIAAGYTQQTLSPTGCSGIVNKDSPGLAYDPTIDRIVGWDGTNTIYLYNVDTNSCSTVTTNTPPADIGIGNGIFKRFRYSPKTGVYTFGNSTATNMWALRLNTVTATDAYGSFWSRCNASGVFMCNGGDNAIVDMLLTGNAFVSNGDATKKPNLDTSIKTSGPSSVRLTVPGAPRTTGADVSGQWFPQFGTGFGQGSAPFYVSWRVRIDQQMLDGLKTGHGYTPWNVSGGGEPTWKFAEILNGPSIFGNLAVVLSNTQSRDLVGGYTEGNNLLVVDNSPTEIWLQQKQSPCNSSVCCPYTNYGAIYSNASCWYFYPNEWVTYKAKITFGHWNTADSTIELWAAREAHTAWTKVLHLPNYSFVEPGSTTQNFNNMNFTLYMTNLSNANGPPTSSNMWIDEVIGSTQDIALPGSVVSGGGTAPTAPINLIVN